MLYATSLMLSNDKDAFKAFKDGLKSNFDEETFKKITGRLDVNLLSKPVLSTLVTGFVRQMPASKDSYSSDCIIDQAIVPTVVESIQESKRPN